MLEHSEQNRKDTCSSFLGSVDSEVADCGEDMLIVYRGRQLLEVKVVMEK
jgi:hypothetical protein